MARRGVTFWPAEVERAVIRGELSHDPVDPISGETFQRPVASDEEIIAEVQEDFARAVQEETPYPGDDR